LQNASHGGVSTIGNAYKYHEFTVST